MPAISRRSPVLLGTALLLLAAAVAAAILFRPRIARRASRPHIIVILVDALRADHLGAYGYHRPTSPLFDAFAERSLLFENARSQAPCTFPSVNSLLTSRYPVEFLGQPEQRTGIPEGIGSLPEILGRYGYQTLAVSASPVVRKSPTRFNPSGGFARGFAVFDESCLWQDARCVGQRALDLLAQSDLTSPVFVYLHFMDPHGPYLPPAHHQRRFAGEYRGDKEFIRWGDPNPIARMISGRGPRLEITDHDLQHLIDLYDDEIAYFDQELGSLLDALDERGLLAQSLLAVVADHGESFLDNGQMKHCRSLFDSELKTPFLLWLPGASGPARVSAPVQNLDLVPTLLDYAGLPWHHLPFRGTSLRSLIEGAEPAGERYAFGFNGDQRSACDERFKLLYDAGSAEFRLYDLRTDPGEVSDALSHHPAAFHRLRKALFDWLLEVEGSVSSPRSRALAREAREQLEALGYLQ